MSCVKLINRILNLKLLLKPTKYYLIKNIITAIANIIKNNIRKYKFFLFIQCESTCSGFLYLVYCASSASESFSVGLLTIKLIGFTLSIN